MPRRRALTKIPLEAYRPFTDVRYGAGGGSRTHFSHPFLDAYYGLLRDFSAARRLSRSAFGGRANPGLVAPGNLDRACWNCISLLKIEGFLATQETVEGTVLSMRLAATTVRVSHSTLRLLLALLLPLCEHFRSTVYLS